MNILSGLGSLASGAIDYVLPALIPTNPLVGLATAAARAAIKYLATKFYAARPVKQVLSESAPDKSAAEEKRKALYQRLNSVEKLDRELDSAINEDRTNEAIEMLTFCEEESLPNPNAGIALINAVKKDNYPVIQKLCANKSIEEAHLFLAMRVVNARQFPDADKIRQELQCVRERLRRENGVGS
jgi:hypothetical protein